MQEKANHKTFWKIQKFASDEDVKTNKFYEEVVIEDNILVNAGINEMWKLIAGGTATAFNNANSYLGVGDSNTAAVATQTDLQAVTNKIRKAMNATFPISGTSQKITFQSDFGSAEANFAWKEFAVFNASSAGVMINRKVSDQGTKVSGQTWRLSLEITLS
ncbi:MAG: hypothetical protein RBR14_05600 [Candidatus Cloacimonas acidaminovorans]|nr:hypothetical protein [Candidatus Cloacimonas acidaminovorans]